MRPPAQHLWRRMLLIGCLLCLTLAWWRPTWMRDHAAYRMLLVVDITGSMNVRDYQHQGRPQSRLARSQQTLVALLQQLPCGSRAGLAVFSERRSFLLLDDMEVCRNYSPLSQAIQTLSWRMAWEGDSHIAKGLYSALQLAQGQRADLIFITDGHEAPPLPHTGIPEFDAKEHASETRGLILGAGGPALSPIPKFNEQGEEIGFLSADEVDQENRLGLPPSGSQEREGWHPRNAPFGAAKAQGQEHLSSVKSTHLQTLAAKTGLQYEALDGVETLLPVIRRDFRADTVRSPQSTRPAWLGVALLCLVLYYLSARWTPLAGRRRSA